MHSLPIIVPSRTRIFYIDINKVFMFLTPKEKEKLHKKPCFLLFASLMSTAYPIITLQNASRLSEKYIL